MDDDLDPDDELMAVNPDDHRKWEKMMRQRKEQLHQTGSDSRRWLDAMTRRRMFAYSRIRKLHQAHVERQRFNNKMAAVVERVARRREDDAEDVPHTVVDTPGDGSDVTTQSPQVTDGESSEGKSDEDKQELARSHTDMSLPVISESPELSLPRDDIDRT